MDCPVCGSRAHSTQSWGIAGETVRCPTCGDYEITDAVLVNFSKLATPEKRRTALEYAKQVAQPGRMPLISSYLL